MLPQLSSLLRDGLLVILLACSLGTLGMLTTIPAAAQTTMYCAGSCVHGWFNSGAYLGGVECEHGPENDGDCVSCSQPEFENGQVVGIQVDVADSCCETQAGNDCLYLKPGAQQGSQNMSDYNYMNIPDCDDPAACKCYSCLPNTGCEGTFLDWLNHCGETETETDAVCADLEEVPGTTEDDVTSKFRPTLPPPNDAPCAGGNVNSGVNTRYFCGSPGGPTDTAKCIANNCPENPNAAWVTQETGKRYRCKNGSATWP